MLSVNPTTETKMPRLIHRAIHDPLFWKWPSITGLSGLAVWFLLTGCGTVEPYWKVVDPNYRVPVRTYRLASAEALTRICIHPRREDQGCAYRLPDECRVYLGPKADACIESHERNGHCGEDGTGAKTHSNRLVFEQDCAYPTTAKQ